MEYINIPSLLQYVSFDKQQRINAFRDRRDSQLVLMADLLIRAVACRYLSIKNDYLDFRINEYGKPYIYGSNYFYYNLSHSGRWVVCAVNHDQVGIDIEEIVPIELDIAQNYLSKKEITYIVKKPEVERAEAFYVILTLKESYIKAMGYGLSKNLNSFTVKIISKNSATITKLSGNSSAFLRQYKIDEGYRLFLCAFENCFPEQIQLVDIKWILDAFV